MKGSDQQVETPAEQAKVPSRLAAIGSDSYSLLMAFGVVVLAVSLAGLASLWFSRYGPGPRPVIGKVTGASRAQIEIDLGSDKGLKTDDRLLVLRRGTLLANLQVMSVSQGSSTAVIVDTKGEPPAADGDEKSTIVALGDTVILSPLGRKQGPPESGP